MVTKQLLSKKSKKKSCRPVFCKKEGGLSLFICSGKKEKEKHLTAKSKTFVVVYCDYYSLRLFCSHVQYYFPVNEQIKMSRYLLEASYNYYIQVQLEKVRLGLAN